MTAAVTVVVATHNRADRLRSLLAALRSQTFTEFEVVVVDDASTDGTGEVLRGAAVRSVRLERNGGPAAARNAGWRSATTDLIAFTDDDCTPTPTWLEEGLRAFTDPCVLVGATEPDPAEVSKINPLARTMRVRSALVAPTCNVFYARDDLESCGGFDESFRLPVGEDTDLAWRVAELGRELRFAPNAVVFHDVRQRTLAQALDETRRCGGIPPVAARHPVLARRAWPGRFYRRSHPRALLAAASIGCAVVFPPALVLTLPWLRARIFQGRPSRRWITNARYAPAALLVELYEIVVLAKGSVAERTLIL